MIRSASCCSGIYGSPAMAEQAPCRFVGGSTPRSLLIRVGTRIYSVKPPAPQPVWRAPVSVIAGPCTTSKQCGASPGPIPSVGVQPPSVPTLPNSAAVAPQSNSTFGTLAWVAGGIILLWIFAGALTRKALL